MTDVAAPVPARREAASLEVGIAVRVLLATLSFAAGAIHLVMAPSHAGESTIEGAGFLIAGWLQVGLAAALLLQSSRLLLRATVVLNLVLIGLWAVSRIWGLPFGAHAWHPEDVSAVDLTCVGIEAGLILMSTALLTRPGMARVLDGSAVFTGVLVPIGVVALASGVLLSPSARDHASGSHGGHGMAGGHGHDGATAAGHHEVAEDDLGLSALENGHQHGSGEIDLDPRTQAALDDELAETQKLIDKYPNLGSAEAAGYRRAGPFVPGLGTHLVNYGGYVGDNPDVLVGAHENMNPVLIFDGLGEKAPLSGFMYMVLGGTEGQPPVGFVGPNDHWHYHTNTCVVFRDGEIEAPLGADAPNVTPELCSRYGGSLIDNTGYMVHVWTVPGYESERGVFSNINPALTCPDGTYYILPVEEWGWKKNACLNAS
jgi:hypothetical protein